LPSWLGSPEAGAAIGLIIGVWVALRFFAGHRTFGAIAWRGLIAIVTAGVISYAVITLGNAGFSQLGLNATVPTVDFEIRMPAEAHARLSSNDVQVELHTDKNQLIAKLDEIDDAEGRLMLRGSVPLVFRTTRRTIILSLPGEPIRSFRLLLQANPPPTTDFGPWQQVDYLDQQGQQSRRIDVTEDYSIRYRVR
jgi:hypothetical protein